jgi:hypothetical protein
MSHAGQGQRLGAAVPASAPTTTLEGLKPFFIPGETITWDVSYAGVLAGRARLAIGEVGDIDGRRIVVLRGEAESSGVVTLFAQARDTVASWIDVDSGLPTRTESVTTGMGKPIVVHAQRASGQTRIEVDVWGKDGDHPQHKTQKLPSTATHDPLSAILALRAWDAPAGTRVLVYSVGGVRVWKNVFTVVGREVIEGPLGKRSAVRIAGVSTRMTPGLADDTGRPPRTFTIWVTDDDQRIPVQLAAQTEFGEVFAQATSYVRAD